MATTAKESIKVKQLTKFGFQLENGEYINFSKTLKDGDKGRIIPGGAFDVMMYRADSGKGYLNSVIAAATPSASTPLVAVAPKVAEVKETIPLPTKRVPNLEAMSKSEWQAKDRSQLIGGLSHDAAELAAAAVAYNVPISSVVDQYKLALGLLIKIREEVK